MVSPSLLCVLLKQSKTDPFRAGVATYNYGAHKLCACLVVAVLTYKRLKLSHM